MKNPFFISNLLHMTCLWLLLLSAVLVFTATSLVPAALAMIGAVLSFEIARSINCQEVVNIMLELLRN